MQGVYKILNKVNGKFYIGSSINLENRFQQHKKELRLGKHSNSYLQRAWNKYGEQNFEFIVIEEVIDKNKLRDRETYYLKSTNCTDHRIGYNLLNDANVGLGVQASSEVRKKISDACKGTKNGNYGRKHTPEEIKKIRENRYGKNYVCKLKKSNYVRKSPEELEIGRLKRSNYMKNRVVSETTRKKLSIYHTGLKASDETRQKMSSQRKGLKNSNSKLSREQVLEIYEKMNNGVNYKDVCKEYGIGQCWAYKIKRKEHWVFNDNE